MLNEIYEKLIPALGDVHVSYIDDDNVRNIHKKGIMEGFLVTEDGGVVHPYKLNGQKPIALPLPTLTGKPHNPFGCEGSIEFFHPLYEAASDKKTPVKGFIDRLVGVHLNDHTFSILYLLANLVVAKNAMVNATPEQRNAVSKLKNVNSKTVEFLSSVATKDIKSNKRNAFCKLITERHVNKTSNYKAEAVLGFPLYTEVMDDRIPNPMKTTITKEVREGIKQLYQTLLDSDECIPTTFNGYSNNAMCPVFLSTMDAVYRIGYRINTLYELLGPLAWKPKELERKLVDLSFVETMNWLIDNPVEGIKAMKEVPQQSSSYPMVEEVKSQQPQQMTSAPPPPTRPKPIPILGSTQHHATPSPHHTTQSTHPKTLVTPGVTPVDFGEITKGHTQSNDYGQQTNSQFPGVTKDGLGFFYINGRKGSLQEQQYFTDMEKRMMQPLPMVGYGQYSPPQGMYPPPQGQYLNNGYPPPQGMYPPPQQQVYTGYQQAGYPPPQGMYPPLQGQYPNNGYPPPHRSPPPQGQYPNNGYPPPQGMYPPPQGQHSNQGYPHNPGLGYGKV